MRKVLMTLIEAITNRAIIKIILKLRKLGAVFKWLK